MAGFAQCADRQSNSTVVDMWDCKGTLQNLVFVLGTVCLLGGSEAMGASSTRSARAESAKQDASSRAIDQLVAAQHFGEAIQALERDIKNGADRQALLKQTLEQAAAYDQATAAAIRSAAESEDWQTAFRYLYEGARNYPEGPQIRKRIEELAPRQNARIRELRIALIVERADWILKTRPILKELSYTDLSDVASSSAVDQLAEESKRIAAELSAFGIEALGNNNLPLAERCLAKSDELYPSAENIRALERLDHRRNEVAHERQRQERERLRADSERQKKQRRADAERTRQEARNLASDVRGAIRRSELGLAQQLLGRLEETDPEYPELEALRGLLDTTIAVRVDELLAHGNDLYGNGNIREARDVWEQARLLNPDNSRVRDRIFRADQVLNNLDEQQRRSSSSSP